MSALAGTGLLIKYSLISGQESWVMYGEKVDLSLWGMDRHEWGYIHLILGYIILGLVLLHVILHWKIVVAVDNRLFKGSLMVRLVTLLIVAICAFFIIAPFFVQPKVVESEKKGGNHSGKGQVHTSSEHIETPTPLFHSFIF